jgi:hypothetical protein
MQAGCLQHKFAGYFLILNGTNLRKAPVNEKPGYGILNYFKGIKFIQL